MALDSGAVANESFCSPDSSADCPAWADLRLQSGYINVYVQCQGDLKYERHLLRLADQMQKQCMETGQNH